MHLHLLWSMCILVKAKEFRRDMLSIGLVIVKTVSVYRVLLKKHGFNNHKYEILEECSVDKLWEREVYWEQYYKNKGVVLLNLKACGGRYYVKDSTKEKISKYCTNEKIQR